VHAHLLMTTREVTAHGLGPRTTIELGGEERQARGLGATRNEYFWVRAQWAQITNEALREAGLTARIDHRSFKDQGVEREPTPKIPQKVYYAERRSGRSTQAGDDIRARHRERVEARLKGSDELARVLQRQKEEARQRAVERSKQTAGVTKKIPRGALTRQELSRLKLEWHHANKERVNQRRRERYKENAEVILKKQRAWRQANAQKINERRRQFRQTNAEKLRQQARERWSKAREQRQAATKAAQESTLADRNARSLGQNSSSATAAESARKWLEFRERQKQAPTAQESARKWLEFRARQKQANHSQTSSEERSHERGLDGNADDDDQRRKTNRSRDEDYGL
jgi:MobA/MobL family